VTVDPLNQLLEDEWTSDWILPEDREDAVGDVKADGSTDPYRDWSPATSFVIAGPLPDGPVRPGEERRPRFRYVEQARRWATKKYGPLLEGGRNLEPPGSMRWAFRVRRPEAK
jgi:hypothetical protein